MSKHYLRSFAGGEVAPLLFGRLDLAKHQTGLAKCLNFMVTPQGPIENRPGFEYVLKTKQNGAVLIPFSYNSEQTFALEFGDQYIRFHTQGGTLLETAQNITGISQAATGVLTYAGADPTNGQWFYLSGIGGMTALNGRYVVVTNVNAGANTFELYDLFGNAIDTSGMAAYTAGGTMARVYELSTPYAAADVFDLHYVQSADVLTITHQGYEVRELRRLGATNWTLTTVSFSPTISAPAGVTLTPNGSGGSPQTHLYVATAIRSGTLEESLASPSDSDSLDLTVAGNFIDVAPDTVSGAVRYNIYKYKGGVYGYIGQSSGSSLRDNNIEPDMSKTPPLAQTPFASENPQAVSYFEQRRCFGGGGTNPQTVWMTRSGTESNMTYSIPVQDDDAITARIVAREAQAVRHLVPLNDLLALTSGGVWRIGSAAGEAITPSNLSAKPQSYVGASMAQPVVTQSSVIYAQDRGSHVRELSYKWETQNYQSEDVSVIAPHLFDFKSVIQLSYSKTPYQVLWAVRSDGVLLGLTHQPEHEVKAWHQHDTSGLFKSVCAIAEGDDDGIYVIAEREINGDTVQYIERMHSRNFAALEDCFFVDSGLTYDSTATTTITGLWHLEGEEVAVLADGGVHPAVTVSNGTITLESAASKVHVGLAYNADAKTMPLGMEGAAALGQGPEKNVSKVWLRLEESSGVKAGPDFDNLREYAQRTTEMYATPPDLITGVIELTLDPKWQRDGSVCIRQANPLPMTLQAMTLEVAGGG